MPQMHDFSFLAILVRLFTAAAAGGIVGYGRSKRNRAAGLRTYMLISMAAALTMLLGCYEFEMLQTHWADVVSVIGMKFDGSRYASQVIPGVGFLDAGTIMSSVHQQVSGLTTAIGLFACAGMGLAAGAGMYFFVVVLFLVLIINMDHLYYIELKLKRRMRNFTVYVEFNHIEDLSKVTDLIRSRNAAIFEIDLEHTKRTEDDWPGAVISVKLPQDNTSHTDMMTSIAELPCVHLIKELVS